MPRYFFHQRRRQELFVDDEGSEFDSDRRALEEAMTSAREMMSEAILEGRDVSGRAFEVTDDQGRRVLILRFRDTIIPED